MQGESGPLNFFHNEAKKTNPFERRNRQSFRSQPQHEASDNEASSEAEALQIAHAIKRQSFGLSRPMKSSSKKSNQARPIAKESTNPLVQQLMALYRKNNSGDGKKTDAPTANPIEKERKGSSIKKGKAAELMRNWLVVD